MCGENIKVHGDLLYRAPQDGKAAPAEAHTQANIQQPSAGLVNSAETTLAWGIVSIALGWTLIVPLCGGWSFLCTQEKASDEKVSIPVKGWIGFTLTATFGVFQAIAAFRYLANH